jgi:hypothetical protein
VPKIAGWVVVGLIVALNVSLLVSLVRGRRHRDPARIGHPTSAVLTSPLAAT